MTTIALDATAVGALAGTESGVVAITDAAGTVIGYFAPVKQEYAEHYAELAARASSVWGTIGPPNRPLTTAEVLARMQAL